MHSARRTETVLRCNQLPARSHKSSISRHLRHLTVFQLLIRCVHPRACDILRTWSTIVQSVTMSSSTGCISACIVVSKSIVDGLISYWQAQRTNCVSKMKSQSQWSANAYKEAHNGLYTPTLKSLRLDRAEAVHQVVSKGASHVIPRGSTVPRHSLHLGEWSHQDSMRLGRWSKSTPLACPKPKPS